MDAGARDRAVAEALRLAVLEGREARLRVSTGCMGPFIRAGDEVVLAPGAPRRGDVVVYEEDGVLYAHRLVAPGGAGRDPLIAPDSRPASGRRVSAAHIVGRVRAVEGPGRSRDLRRLGWRLHGAGKAWTARLRGALAILVNHRPPVQCGP